MVDRHLIADHHGQREECYLRQRASEREREADGSDEFYLMVIQVDRA